MSNATGVRCRGTCKAGHTTEAAADPGRVTWHGECATEGCDLKVYCRRVPADTPAPPPDTRTAETDPHRVLEVPGYRDEPAPPVSTDDDAAGQQQPAELEPAGDEPAAEPARPAKQAAARRRRQGQRRRAGAAPAPPVQPAPPRPERPRGVFGRLRARLDGDEHADTDEDRLFGVY